MSNCRCGHDEKSHILIAKRDQSNKRCTECNDCEGFIESVIEGAIAGWADEAHKKMYEDNTKGLIAKQPHPYRSDEKGCPGILPDLEERLPEANPDIFKVVEEGKKFDGDKLRLDLIPTILLRGVAWILTFGAKKYGDRNWEQGILYHRLWGAMLRHLMAWYDGEELDPESHKPHLWHAACNLSFLMHFEDNKDRYESFDDRPCQADRPFNS